MEPEQVSNPQTDATKSAEQQLADIKSQASKIVQQAQKISPNTNFVSEADAEMIGLPRLNVPTDKRVTETPGELSRVGSTTIPKTGTDKAREALLSQVPEEDQATISAILDASMGLQTERGAELEGDLESMTAERLDLAKSAKQRATERGEMLTEARVPELEAELESIRGEADVLSAQRNAAIQREAARAGTSTQAQNNNIAAIEKDFNLQQANLAIRELAAVGKVNAATRLIQSKLDIKYGDIEAETELVKAQIDSILPLLSREDKKVAEQRLMLNQVAQNTIEDAREADKVLEEFKLQSYMNAQANGATPALLSMIMSSDNREDVLSVGGSFVEDPMASLERRQAEASISSSLASVEASRAATRQREAETNLLLNPPATDVDADVLETIESLGTSEVQSITGARETVDEIDRMIQIINSVDDVKQINPGSELGREFNKLKENVVDKLARERTGAVVGAEEQKTFEKIIGVRAFDTFMSSDDEQVKQLERLKNKHNEVLSLNDPEGKVRAYLDAQSLDSETQSEFDTVWGVSGSTQQNFDASRYFQ